RCSHSQDTPDSHRTQPSPPRHTNDGHGDNEPQARVGALTDEESCGARRTCSGAIINSTPRPKIIKAPFSTTSIRLAFNTPLGSFSSTGLSETTLPLVTLTVASDRCPS